MNNAERLNNGLEALEQSHPVIYRTIMTQRGALEAMKAIAGVFELLERSDPLRGKIFTAYEGANRQIASGIEGVRLQELRDNPDSFSDNQAPALEDFERQCEAIKEDLNALLSEFRGRSTEPPLPEPPRVEEGLLGKIQVAREAVGRAPMPAGGQALHAPKPKPSLETDEEVLGNGAPPDKPANFTEAPVNTELQARKDNLHRLILKVIDNYRLKDKTVEKIEKLNAGVLTQCSAEELKNTMDRYSGALDTLKQKINDFYANSDKSRGPGSQDKFRSSFMLWKAEIERFAAVIENVIGRIASAPGSGDLHPKQSWVEQSAVSVKHLYDLDTAIIGLFESYISGLPNIFEEPCSGGAIKRIEDLAQEIDEGWIFVSGQWERRS